MSKESSDTCKLVNTKQGLEEWVRKCTWGQQANTYHMHGPKQIHPHSANHDTHIPLNFHQALLSNQHCEKTIVLAACKSELSHLDQPGAPYTVILQGNQTEKSLATTIHKTRKCFHNQNHEHLSPYICIKSQVVTKCESPACKIEYHLTKPDHAVTL